MKDNQISEDALFIVTNILDIAWYLLRVGNRIAGKFDLTQQQFVVLNEIINKSDINQKQLVDELFFEKSNVSKIIKKLKSLKYIDVLKSENDGRMTIINATEKGKTIWNTCMEKFNDWNLNFVESLESEEIIEIVNSVKAIKRLKESESS